MAPDVCEMKRLYVRPVCRGGGVGKLLAEAIITEARQIGYAVMRLDTVPKLAAATRLYESLGFVRRDAYYKTPVAETIFMEMRL
jgi:GNAT superfamily N-acetyltransferase